MYSCIHVYMYVCVNVNIWLDGGAVAGCGWAVAGVAAAGGSIPLVLLLLLLPLIPLLLLLLLYLPNLTGRRPEAGALDSSGTLQ